MRKPQATLRFYFSGFQGLCQFQPHCPGDMFNRNSETLRTLLKGLNIVTAPCNR